MWAEQTYGPVGGWCDDGTGGVRQLSLPGPCHGGRRAEVSDLASTLTESEHLAGITVARNFD